MAEVILGVAGLAIGVPGVLDIVQKLGKELKQRIKRYDPDHKKLTDLIIQTNQSQSHEMMHYFVSEGNAIPEDLQSELLALFQALRSIYEELLAVLPPDPTNYKLSEKGKRRIDAAVRKLEDWNERFLKRAIVFVLFGRHVREPDSLKDPSATENEGGLLGVKKIERLRDAVETTLSKSRSPSQQLSIVDPEPDDRNPLAFSSLQLCRPRDPARRPFLAEYRTYSDDASERDIQGQRKIVREVAAVLHEADPKMMGVLHCHGFYWDAAQNRFELRFHFPPGLSRPRTLLDLLCDPDTQKRGAKHPLNHRIRLAKSIVSAVFVLHSADLVHKQIRPDNIVVFDQEVDNTSDSDQRHQQYPYVLGDPFLLGYDAVRKADAASLMLHVEDWKKNIYLSPDRHRLQPGDEFRMEHDIYSLGVVLLEIAFWASFQDRRSPSIGHLVWHDSKSLRSPEQLKQVYLSLASGPVARLMGQRYADVVRACINGLEDKVQERSLEDVDGIIVGTAYITEIIRGLEEIRL
ncbi:serine/threonine protein kinase [Nannizzia gypsea CBS 118893]|uniref:Serine/threonine protein kinase n=1 Tax=Arthroderma gypseum (strain ATCC MYA-4604 / CBS 118893) TaxID=535722 RepID=E4UYZ4_ARTGP|nr:serine/threonine protein kinase [Nannizzia gypsea CBS 118893]EFR03324.1 serine/threonine protein kinase [Nannizzia gypsea CBS 118893]